MILLDEIARAVLPILSLQSIYALVLFPLIWGLVACCRGRYARLQHGLWLLILLRLVLPPDMAAPWSAGHLARSVIPYAVSKQFLAFPSTTVIDTIQPKRSGSAPLEGPRVAGHDPSGMALTIGSNPSDSSSPSVLTWFRIAVMGAYVAVVTLLLLLFVRTRRRFWKMAWQAKPLQDPAVLQQLHNWRRRLKIRRRIALKVVRVDVPTYTIGFLRPVIVIPSHLTASTESAALEAVLAHELVHVKRWDDLAICLQELVRIVYFFHPLVWFVMPRLTWTREAICDAAVLGHKAISPRVYGEQLLCLGRNQPSLQPSMVAPAVFTPAARAMAFRLNHIQKEDHMKSNPLFGYLTVLILGVFLLPMAPVASSNQAEATDGVLRHFVLQCAPCQNPEEVGNIVWGEFITDDLQEGDFSRLVSMTDCDVVADVGDGQKAYVFYLLSNSRKGVYRPNYHFIMNQGNLELLFKSRNLATYATDRERVNGRYEIEEGWRADFVDGLDDDRVDLAWGASVWFWSGTRYLKAYTEFTIEEATDPSLLGTTRQWEKENRSVYQQAPRE